MRSYPYNKSIKGRLGLFEVALTVAVPIKVHQLPELAFPMGRCTVAVVSVADLSSAYPPLQSFLLF